MGLPVAWSLAPVGTLITDEGETVPAFRSGTPACDLVGARPRLVPLP